jgi:hypothetical protein
VNHVITRVMMSSSVKDADVVKTAATALKPTAIVNRVKIRGKRDD